MEKINIKKELYPKEAIIKAAYHFINQAYIFIDMVDDEYIIEITKKTEDTNDLIKEFKNELLAQTIRHQIYLETHVLREVLMARAMASSIIGTATELSNAEVDEQISQDSEDLDIILKDWFETYEE